MEIDFNEHVYYCEDSPTFLRRAKDVYSGRYYNIKEASLGDVAGSTSSSSGYSQVKIQKKLYLCHVIIWNIHYGRIPEGMFIDHLNGNRQDNRITNLRLTDRIGNSRNCKMRDDNTSGVKGITLLTNKYKSGKTKQYWVAFWCEGGKNKRKFFSVDDYGFETSRQLAVDFRAAKIEELNLMGYGYTDRHKDKS